MRKWTFRPEATAKAMAALTGSGFNIPELELRKGSILKRHQWQK